MLGSLTKPEATATNVDAVAEWIGKDEKATAKIILFSTAMQIAHIKSCGTSSDTWRALKEVHRKGNTCIRLRYLDSFYKPYVRR